VKYEVNCGPCGCIILILILAALVLGASDLLHTLFAAIHA
jgi:hypothetical protein